MGAAIRPRWIALVREICNSLVRFFALIDGPTSPLCHCLSKAIVVE